VFKLGWEKLGSTKLTTAGDTITVDSLTAKKHLMIQVHIIQSGQLDDVVYRFNNDTGSNYANRRNGNGGSDSTHTSNSYIWFYKGTPSAQDEHVTSHVINESSKEKLVISEMVLATAGAGNAPDRAESVGKWANTSNQITRVDVVNINGTGDFDTDSECTVYGTD